MELIEKTAKEASTFFQNFFNYEVVGDGLLQKIDPRIKMPGLISLVVASVSTFSSEKLILLLSSLVILLAVSRIPLRIYVSRIWMIPLFSFVIVLPHTFMASVGYEYALLFTFRVFLAVSFLTLIMLTTRFSDVLYVLRFYKVPDVFVTVLSTTYRYIHLMFCELYRMLLARESRRIREQSSREIWKHGGKMLGFFFIRAYERAERVHLASIARGYEGRTKVYGKRFRLTANELLFALLIFITLAGWFNA